MFTFFLFFFQKEKVDTVPKAAGFQKRKPLGRPSGFLKLSFGEDMF